MSEHPHKRSDSFTPVSSVLPGVYNVAQLSSTTLPSNNQAKYAFVSDLGGGADMVLSDGTYWKHIRQGIVTKIAAAGSITLTPLYSPPIIQFTGSNVASMMLSIATTNLYPGETFRLITPNGVLSVLGTFGVSVSGVSNTNVSLLAQGWQDIQWDGTTLIKTAGGTL